jgi:hypothetical protein
MQIRPARLARVERHDYPLSLEINRHIPHPADLHERPAQLAHALVAILSCRSNLDLLEDGMIGALGKERTRRIGIIWSRWVHAIYSTRFGRLAVAVEFSRQRGGVKNTSNIE